MMPPAGNPAGKHRTNPGAIRSVPLLNLYGS